MAKIYFRYGTMNSAKTMNLLTAVHSYEETGRKCLLLKPDIDTRDKNVIRSRAGIEKECTSFALDQDMAITIMAALHENNGDIDAIFVDEVQFCTKQQIRDLVDVALHADIPILCYGLRSDYTGKLFPAIETLMVYADSIEEIKTVCRFCDKKAMMNLRLVDGLPVYEGDSVKIEDIKDKSDVYLQVCKEHYFSPIIKASN